MKKAMGVGLVLAATLTIASAADAHGTGSHEKDTLTVAVYGDAPYGTIADRHGAVPSDAGLHRHRSTPTRT